MLDEAALADWLDSFRRDLQANHEASELAQNRSLFSGAVKTVDRIQKELPRFRVVSTRSSDPSTSHKAAGKVKRDLSKLQQHVLQWLRVHGPSTEDRIWRGLQQDGIDMAESSPRKRCFELEELRLVRRRVTRELNLRGNEAIVWEAVLENA